MTWFVENALIDDSYETAGGHTTNHLTFPNVGRQHLKARLICQATNNNLVPPVTKVVILDVNCKYSRLLVFARIGDKYCDLETAESKLHCDFLISGWEWGRI